jgi:hypothetical protein
MLCIGLKGRRGHRRIKLAEEIWGKKNKKKRKNLISF